MHSNKQLYYIGKKATKAEKRRKNSCRHNMAVIVVHTTTQVVCPNQLNYHCSAEQATAMCMWKSSVKVQEQREKKEE